MTNKIYPYETVYSKAQHKNLAKIKVHGDRWCRHHCSDLHTSRMVYDNDGDDRIIFYFRSDSDLTAFRIGFDIYDL